MGEIKLIAVTIRSEIPYSAVDRTDVYKGTSKNVSTLDEKLPIASNITFYQVLYIYPNKKHSYMT